MSAAQVYNLGDIEIEFPETRIIMDDISFPWSRTTQRKQRKTVTQIRAEILAQQLVESTNSSFSIKAFI